MAVVGTRCQICALPVNHDHLVKLKGAFGIYRGEADEIYKPAFPFGPEHEWLKDSVALRVHERQNPALAEGQIHDGWINADVEDSNVYDGRDERAALHRVCWELAGKPGIWVLKDDPPLTNLLKLHWKQLFDFAGFGKSPEAWMLHDPRSKGKDGAKNLARIRACVGRIHI